jgi:hypothetical protein
LLSLRHSVKRSRTESAMATNGFGDSLQLDKSV